MTSSHYFDTSALIKKYILEKGTADLRNLLRNSSAAATSHLTYAEIHSAFQRLRREGRMTLTQLREKLSEFETDWPNFILSTFSEDVRQKIPSVMEKYVLRGADGLHLASALILSENYPGLVFVSSDHRLVDAAKHEKLKTWNPAE